MCLFICFIFIKLLKSLGVLLFLKCIYLDSDKGADGLNLAEIFAFAGKLVCQKMVRWGKLNMQELLPRQHGLKEEKKDLTVIVLHNGCHSSLLFKTGCRRQMVSVLQLPQVLPWNTEQTFGYSLAFLFSNVCSSSYYFPPQVIRYALYLLEILVQSCEP